MPRALVRRLVILEVIIVLNGMGASAGFAWRLEVAATGARSRPSAAGLESAEADFVHFVGARFALTAAYRP